MMQNLNLLGMCATSMLCHKVFNFIQIGPGHTVFLEQKKQICIFILSRPWRENVSHFLRTYLCSTYIYCALLVWTPTQLGSPLHSGSK